MHKEGYAICDNETYLIDTCLFDTGAQSDNYIAQSFVDKYSVVFKDSIFDHKSSVRLGDSVTTVNITQLVTLTVSFIDNNSITHTSILNFSIMPIKHLNMIIGINSILFSFFDLFTDMLKTARNLIVNSHNKITPNNNHNNVYTKNNLINKPLSNITQPLLSNAIPPHKDYTNCIPTWSIPLDDIAPEELDTPDPCSFTEPLFLIGPDRDEIVANYHNLLLSNINPDMIAEIPEVLDFMKSDIALSVFCPEGWTGIRDIPPLSLEFSDTLPRKVRPACRPVKDTILEQAKNEFDRLSKYMYVTSNSSVTSPLVIAPKPTPPYVRFCGDYVYVNKFVNHIQHFIPNVMQELTKAAKSKYFNDLDMKNAFHQISLDNATSNNLSVLTPWGNVRPLFMPEGISPASGVLNTVMTDIFRTELEHAIIIFDNFLVLADTMRDCYNNLVTFITICADRDVILGMPKSRIGFPHATFFGYRIQDGKYELTQERKNSVTSLVFPTNLKQAQSFLGATVFFRQNIPTYASIAAPLNDMCKKTFS